MTLPATPPPIPVPVIDIRELSHTYKSHRALSGISFSVAPKSIHGFVGPNGAGKTTTLKILATLLQPRTGIVRVFGRNVVSEQKEVRKKIGFMPDHFSMYRQMTVFEYLDFFGAAYGFLEAARNKIIGDVLALTDMAGRKDDLISGLSRGMQQRVSLARVLVHDPDLLLLDEPASGLDPRARIELMEILQELRSLGKTIFISSHILSELATLCDHVTIMDRGTIKYTGTMDGLTLREGGATAYAITLAAPHPACEAALRELGGMISVTRDEATPRYVLSFETARLSLNAVLGKVIESGGEIASVQEDRKQLNEAFMDLTEPGVRT